jgi:uncharacterized protein YutD
LCRGGQFAELKITLSEAINKSFSSNGCSKFVLTKVHGRIACHQTRQGEEEQEEEEEED